jgi:hypothetical protein
MDYQESNPQVKRVRHAEKSRESSCAFADHASSLVIDLHQKISHRVGLQHLQTVLAAILIHLPGENGNEAEIVVAGLGLGTKVLSAEMIEQERNKRKRKISPSKGQDDVKDDNRDTTKGRERQEGDRRIRDLHAEVLARRAFRRYLLEEIKSLYSHYSTKSSHASEKELLSRTLIIDEVSGKLSLREGVAIHLYTSSQPCGNACIKRWGKSSKPKQYPNLFSCFTEFPKDEEVEVTIKNDGKEIKRHEVQHPVFHVTARKEGEIALLAKRNRTLLEKEKDEDTSREDMILDRSALSHPSSKSNLLQEDSNLLVDPLTGYVHPIGTIPLTSSTQQQQQRGNVMTCSDKIARWNILGLQGSFLSHFLTNPLYLRTVIVGRKFSEVHGRRALCCRFAGKFDFKKFQEKQLLLKQSEHVQVAMTMKQKEVEVLNNQTYRASHPTMLCTATKLDESVYCTVVSNESNTTAEQQQSGADFSDYRCLVAWWKGNRSESTRSVEGKEVMAEEDILNAYDYEVLDGRNGLVTGFSYDDALPWFDDDEDRAMESTTQQSIPLYISRVSSYLMQEEVKNVISLMRNNNKVEGDRNPENEIVSLNYEEMKNLSVEYQTVKQYLLSDTTHLLGGWIIK